MTLSTFFRNFDQFAGAPNAVAKMRELVLRLAMQGKLVQQDSEDGAADILLEALAVARDINGRRKATNPLESIELREEEQWHDVPASWRWVRLGTVGDIVGGGTPRSDNPKYFAHDGIPWITPADLNGFKEKRIFRGKRCITRLGLENSSAQLLPEGSILFSSRAPIGYVAIAGIELTTNQGFKSCVPYIREMTVFLYYYLMSVAARIDREASGTTFREVSGKLVSQIPVPLPPLSEQQRIVAKLDELMALCDQLDAQEKEREMRHTALAHASLVRFANIPNPVNLNFLFHPSYTISPSDLRKTILTLAVQGKLVPQDPSHEPAVDLLAALEVERQRFAQAHGFREQFTKPLDNPILPFAIPGGWTCCRLSSLVNAITDGDHLPPPKSNSGIAFLTIGNITTGKLDFEGSRFVPESYYQRLAEYRRPMRGDILYTVVGATYGRSVLVDTDRPFCVQRHVAILKPSQHIDVGFLMTVLRSPLAYDQATASTTGTAQPTIPLGALRDFVVPLPPLAEQRLIVAKVGQLLALVDQLEMYSAHSRSAVADLLEALVTEMTGTERNLNRNPSLRNTTPMKTRTDSPTEHQTFAEPLTMSTRSFVLRRFAMSSGYRSLGEFDCIYHSDTADADEASPVCLVGLNGSGKSNLIEALAEVFCFLELINLPWNKVASASSRYRENGHQFLLEYTLEDVHGQRLIQVRKTKKSGAEFFIISDDGSEKSVEPGREQLLLLPRRIVGYSSGLNETVSHPFLRTKTIYSEEVRDAAPPEGVEPPDHNSVFDTRTLYMDYESNAAILISNYIFSDPKDLVVFDKFTRVSGVSSFGLRFNRKRSGKSGPNSVVRLTRELKSFLRSFALCAGVEYDEGQIAYRLDFRLTPETVALFRREFRTAVNLFMAMHKWSLLNALILSDEQRKVYLRSDITKGALERPPSVPPSDRVFNIVELKLALSNPAIEIDYSGLSDGEHQFIQVFGTALLFNEPGALFLFDEPESHFNPEWRSNFNLILNSLPNGRHQEYIISTHSPYIVSGSRQGNVYKFTRTNGSINCELVDFETYGASFDFLLKKLFSINSFIDQSARKDLEQIIQRGNVTEMQEAVEEFAESMEKRRLYEAIIQKDQGK